MSGLPVVPAHQLRVEPPEQRWLLEGLWSAGAVGIIGGQPKCFKSFLALQMAVAVASGRPCLERFACRQPGRVLVYAAEDALHIVRERLDGLCAHAGVDLNHLDLWVITADTVRLDLEADRRRLADTVAEHRPRLLILDPFVRLHRVDENVSAAVAPLLATLRVLQRQHDCAIAVVHHARKATGSRAGQDLRGSSEFHAWGDSNLYLRRHGDQVRLTIEHRAQPGQRGLPLVLEANDSSIGLVFTQESPPPEASEPTPSARQRVLDAIDAAGQACTARYIRDHCRMRTATVGGVLTELRDQGILIQHDRGWSRAPASETSLPLPFPLDP